MHEPITTDTGQRIPGLRLGDHRAHALLQALLMFRVLPNGFANRDLRRLLAELLGTVCITAGQMSYDLRRLLAVLCWCRLTEITDSLVELFIQLVHRINTRAQRRVDKQLLTEFRRVENKDAMLARISEASLDRPEDAVRQVVFPVAGGEQTLRDVVAEFKATQAARRARVRTVLEGSYSHHYRAMLPKLLDALTFRCNNSTYRPVMDAVELLHRYKDRDGRAKYYDPTERVPLDGVVPLPWRDAVIETTGKVERIPYELCALGALRDAIRRREIWVVGAAKWRNPETDLPPNFDLRRDVHYEAIRQPLDAGEFIDTLKTRMDTALTQLSVALATGTTGEVSVGTRRNEVWIAVPRPPKQPEPTHLDELKAEVIDRWGMVSLLDVLKEADWLTGFHREFTTIATREQVPAGELRRRILLALFCARPVSDRSEIRIGRSQAGKKPW